MTRRLIATEVHRKLEATTAGLALIMGRTVEEVHAVWDPELGPASFPEEWMRDGQRRSREARAYNNSDNPIWAFQFFAAQLGNTIDVDNTDAGEVQVWMIIPD